MSAERILELKKHGNVALHSGSTSEALHYYTEALNLFAASFNLDATQGLQMKKLNDSQNNNNSDLNGERLCRLESSLYSKRSVVLRKMGQYYFAMKDAEAMVAISPEWFKGYLRQADVQLDCGLYEAALKDYQMALRYLDNRRSMAEEKGETSTSKSTNYDKFINQKIGHVLGLMQRERSFDYQIPWIGAALGLVVGMALITWDFVHHRGQSGYIGHPMLKLAFIGAIAYLFFYLATLQRQLGRKNREELLKPPYSVQKQKKDK